MKFSEADSEVILDHGYVKVVHTWGSEEGIIEAARMSTGGGFKGWGGVLPCPACRHAGMFASDDLYIDAEHAAFAKEHCMDCHGSGRKAGDERLLTYLYKNRHATPFEMCGLAFEVRAPIFVIREWQRHRQQSYNEFSARYMPMPDLNFSPSVHNAVERSQAASQNKQAGTTGAVLDLPTAFSDQEELERYYALGQALYERMLEHGWPKELARCPIPVARYSVMRAQCNLRGWLHFLGLRNAPPAQEEIRHYAAAVQEIVAAHFPRTLKLYNEHGAL